MDKRSRKTSKPSSRKPSRPRPRARARTQVGGRIQRTKSERAQSARAAAAAGPEGAPEIRLFNDKAFRALVENSYDVLVLLSAEGRILYESASAENVLGYSAQERIGHSGLDLIHPDDLSTVQKVLAQIIRQPEVRETVRIRILHRDGAWRWIEAVGMNMLAEPELGAVVVNFRDITARVRAEQEARLLQTIALGISTARDLNSTVENILRLVCEATGWTVGEAWAPRADGARLECHPAWHSREAGMEEFRAASAAFTFAPGVGLPGRAWLTKKPAWVQDVTEDLNFLRASLAHRAGLRAGVCIPVLAGEVVTLVLDFFMREARPQDQHLIELISAIAAEVGIVIEHKRAEEKLAASVAELRALFAAMQDVVLTIDRAGVYREIAPTSSDLLIRPREELLGSTLHDVFPRDRADQFLEIIRRALETRQPERLEYELQLGERRVWFSAVITPMDADNALWVARDITERKRAEKVLQESEERFRLISAVASDYMFSTRVNAAGQLELDWVAGAFESITGYTYDEYVARGGWRAAVHPDDLGQDERDAAMLRANQRVVTEIRTLRKDGEIRWVRVYAQPILDEQSCRLTSIYGAVQDITERIRADEAVRASAASLAEAQRIAHLGSWANDLTTGVVTVSEETYRLLGIPPQELTGETVERFIHPDDRANVRQTIRAAMRGGDTVQVAFRLARADGVECVVHAQFQARHDAAGRVTQLIGTIQDITEREQREREVQVIAALSAALRQATTRAEMLPIILDQSLSLLRVDGAALVLCDTQTNENIIELARGGWVDLTGARLRPDEGISGHVIVTGEIYVSADVANDPRFARARQIADARAAICVPLRAQEQIIGAVWVASRREIDTVQVRLLTAVADIAANAIHRATLHEKTEQQLRRLTALHTIDLAITSSVDLRATLEVLLPQVIGQLDAAAAAVFLYDAQAQSLRCAAARGFRSRAIEKTVTRLDTDPAGRAILERRTVAIPNLASVKDASASHSLFAAEGFVACYCAPLVAKGDVKGVLYVFQRAPLTLPAEWFDWLEALATQTAIAIENAQLFEGLRHSNLELAIAYERTIEGWSRALDLRDKETEGHTQRVTELTLKLARMAGLPEKELVHLKHGALLHDIGKMGVPDRILLKPSALSEEEWEIMRRHPAYAYEMLAPIEYLRPALHIPYCHHEKWDGSGYPRGLKGGQIPLAARLFAVVDVWDALRSDRPYRKGWAEAKMREYLRTQAGIHFDPEVVELFFRMIGENDSSAT